MTMHRYQNRFIVTPTVRGEVPDNDEDHVLCSTVNKDANLRYILHAEPDLLFIDNEYNRVKVTFTGTVL